MLIFYTRCTGANPALGPNCMIPYNYKERGLTDLDKTLRTRFKRLKNQKVRVVCIICRFHNIEQYFNYMQTKFKVAGFQNKRDIYVIVLSSSVYLYSDIYLSRWRWFLAFDGSKIQASVEDFRTINFLKLHHKHMLPAHKLFHVVLFTIFKITSAWHISHKYSSHGALYIPSLYIILNLVFLG